MFCSDAYSASFMAAFTFKARASCDLEPAPRRLSRWSTSARHYQGASETTKQEMFCAISVSRSCYSSSIAKGRYGNVAPAEFLNYRFAARDSPGYSVKAAEHVCYSTCGVPSRIVIERRKYPGKRIARLHELECPTD